ncbi:GNAT family protein [Chelatococcus sp. XZ-Ab1]|uniref:GNAT family N-acetyltransferase n=1 Tax=Chelatococcus sp. XZ-Ab1 TaxID=3034027 RepID=UPI0023E457A6|nr:GNAT family protein [Chelatococcus sp. XZ-Ab1]
MSEAATCPSARASKDGYLYPAPDTTEHHALLDWAEKCIGITFRDDAKVIARVVGGDLRAVVVFDRFSATDCLLHVASSGNGRWFSRELAIRAMAYPFLQCGLPRITAIISEHNAESLRITRKFGFVEEGRMRKAGEHGEDELLFGLLREECRWLPEHGRRLFPAGRSDDK